MGSNHKTIGITGEAYERLADLARESGLSMAQVASMLLSYALERATVEVRISFAEPEGIPAPEPTTDEIRRQPLLPLPRAENGAQKAPKELPGPRVRTRRNNTGAVQEVINLILKENRPLSATEVAHLLGRKPPTLMYTSKHFQRNGNNPVRFTLKEDM